MITITNNHDINTDNDDNNNSYNNNKKIKIKYFYLNALCHISLYF